MPRAVINLYRNILSEIFYCQNRNYIHWLRIRIYKCTFCSGIGEWRGHYKKNISLTTHWQEETFCFSIHLIRVSGGQGLTYTDKLAVATDVSLDIAMTINKNQQWPGSFLRIFGNCWHYILGPWVLVNHHSIGFGCKYPAQCLWNAGLLIGLWFPS